jgi:hypothetical protein
LAEVEAAAAEERERLAARHREEIETLRGYLAEIKARLRERERAQQEAERRFGQEVTEAALAALRRQEGWSAGDNGHSPAPAAAPPPAAAEAAPPRKPRTSTRSRTRTRAKKRGAS